MRIETVTSSALFSSQQCRLDPKYLTFANVAKWKVFDSSLPTIQLGEIIRPVQIKKIAKGELDNEFLLINISDQNSGDGILYLKNVKAVNNIGSDKVDLSDCDIIISKLGMSRGYIFPCPKTTQGIIGSSEFIPYQVKNYNHLPYYIYLLLNKAMLKAYSRLETGKTPSHKRVNPSELLKIEIPYLDDNTIENIVKTINISIKGINELWDTIKPTQSIIDEVFAREFGFDYAKFEELKTHTCFSTGFSAFANNPDLRFSSKFHRDAGAFVMEQLTSVTSKKIKHYLSDPIVLGASVSPNDYSDDGDFYYISMATIKSWAFDPDGANQLKPTYAKNKTDKSVCKDDILLARSGEGTIGKVALIDNDDVKGIFADFTMRIRLTNYNQRFAYYYFRTAYFQYIVEVYKKGLGNNTNIFPIVIREFPMPDLSLDEQQRIVNEVQNEIDKQNSIKEKITELRGKIDIVIENALTQSTNNRGNEND